MRTTVLLLGLLLIGGAAGSGLAEEFPRAVDQAHRVLWSRFIDKRFHIVLDFAGVDGTVLYPTPQECLESKPNAVSWLTPIEDGPMLGGFYLDAAINRWRLSHRDEDRQKARNIASGLLHLAQVGTRPGFLARGVSTDGTTHYAMSSEDQATPWLYGMWRYLHTDIPQPSERERIKAKLIEIGSALRSNRWRVPCDRAPFDYRGSFASINWWGAPRLLFLLKMMHELTGDREWSGQYADALRARAKRDGRTRLDYCAGGMVFTYEPRHSWTCACGVVSLRAAWEMETDPGVRQRYLEGLRASAALAAKSLSLARQFDNDDRAHRFNNNWRVANEIWEPQTTEKQVLALAKRQIARVEADSPRLPYENDYVREPLFAAWIITLCPDGEVLARHRAEILRTIEHYRYDRLCYSRFFPAESAYYQIRLAERP